ncbi:MBL fold metallo-hydrolase [Epidermidibacterium keratini]|uniref:MBL fold metallo-hydrolase n=1 Tax=Epidermidibacterium keratini TaxID=1891644 RepID=A0A7L4YSW2_9ACTN|nr:MBL fold metallo-hydrolase [Epidermidibacterium keratini]QHC02142.1 MBL fold metallo-hydrolase [Epidermidibacterium keratini]
MSSDYTGHVDAGQTSGVRRAGALEITKASVGPMDNNAYLLRSVATGDAILIDAANEPERLVELVRERLGEGVLEKVITTHRHEDHWLGLEMLTGVTGALTFAHPTDAPELPIPSDPLNDGDKVKVGDVELEVIHLRGHTPGSIALYWRDPDGEGHLFTGDSLFPGGVGKTWSEDDFRQLLSDVTERIFDRLPDDTHVYPGHGDDTTLGAERPNLAEWGSRGW